MKVNLLALDFGLIAILKVTNFYLKGARWLTLHSAIGVGLFAILLITLILLYRSVPTSFVPTEDQGYGIAMAILQIVPKFSRTQKFRQYNRYFSFKTARSRTCYFLNGIQPTRRYSTQ